VKRSHVSLGVLVCLMFMSAIVALFVVEPPAGAREPLLLLVGALSAAFGSVMNYWFGSTSSSSHKDDLLAQSVPLDKESTR
jgi:hypothetical protein